MASGANPGTATDEADMSTAGLAIALVGTGIVALSAFLPLWDPGSVSFLRLEGNSLIQQGVGVLVLVFAALAGLDLVRAHKTRAKAIGPLIAGPLTIGYAVFVATDDESMRLCPLTADAFGLGCEQAAPGLGVWAAGAGGLVMLIGGLQLRARRPLPVSSVAGIGVPASVRATTKKCPDCAETIQAAANVCRFCGYRFPRCPECSELVRETDVSCPHCGSALRPARTEAAREDRQEI
jgi:hypothetical protein